MRAESTIGHAVGIEAVEGVKRLQGSMRGTARPRQLGPRSVMAAGVVAGQAGGRGALEGHSEGDALHLPG